MGFFHAQLLATDIPYQEFNSSRARLLSSHMQIPLGQDFYLAFDIELDKDWHVYWKNPGDSGAEPIFEWLTPGLIVSSPIYPLPQRILIEPLVSFGYEGRVLFLFKAQYSWAQQAEIKLKAEWLSCRIECVPSFGEFSIKVDAKEEPRLSPYMETIQAFLEKVPRPGSYRRMTSVFSRDQRSLEIIANTLDVGERLVDFFPDIHTPILLRKPIPLDRNRLELPIDPTMPIIPSTPMSGIVVLEDPQGQISSFEVRIPLNSSYASESQLGLFWILVFAFIGGLILNFMPCVLPVIAIKMMGLLQRKHEENIRLASLSYVLGVVSSFVGLGAMLLALRLGGNALGWGFQLQSPVFVSLLVVFFMMLGFSSLGLFEVKAPYAFLNHPLAKKQSGYMSHFIAGVLSTVVASPCTAPFMGASMGAAVHLGPLEMMLSFASVGMGLASPYLVFLIRPQIVHSIPQPGVWMIVFKESLAFVFFATALWLFWVLHQISPNTISTLGAVFILGFAFWFHQRFQQTVFFLIGVLISFFMAAYCQIYSEDLGSSAHRGTSQDQLHWEHYDREIIDRVRKEGHAVFINFTADWCITCKVNERLSLANTSVIEKIQLENIKLFKADWTRRSPEITSALQAHGRIGVPLYLYWPSGSEQPILLPELLTPALLLETFSSK